VLRWRNLCRGGVSNLPSTGGGGVCQKQSNAFFTFMQHQRKRLASIEEGIIDDWKGPPKMKGPIARELFTQQTECKLNQRRLMHMGEGKSRGSNGMNHTANL